MIEVRKVIDLLEPEQRWRAVIVLAAMLATALLQSAGVVSVMPFIGLVADPQIVHRNPWMAWGYAQAGVENTRQFLIILGFLALLLLAVTNAFAAFSRWLSLRFVWDTHDRLSQRLLHKYLSESYSFYLDRNTATLSKSLLGEVRAVVDNILLPWMDVLAKAATVGVFVLLLVMVDPVLAVLSAGTLSGIYAVIYLATRNRQRELGLRREKAFGDRFQITGEAFGGIKDVKVLGSESYFLSRFREASRRYSQTTTAHSIASELPRFALETVAFGGIIGTIIYLLETRETLVHVLPVLALYALAGFRLIPALQSIFGSLTIIRFYFPSVATLHADLYRVPSGEPPFTTPPVGASGACPITLAFEREIRVERLSFHYPNTTRAALEDISLVIPIRHSVGLVGTTGSGKTTLADLLLGLFTPTSGQILIDGVPLTEANLRAWKRHIGYVPQSMFLSDNSIAQNIAFGVPRDHIDRAAVERAARAAHLHDFIERLPLGYETAVGERGVRLSGGERQRVAIARALYRDPTVLVMDEATSALDGATEDTVMQAIRGLSGQKTIILVAHRLTTVRDCDVIFLFEGGRLAAQGTFSALANGNQIFRAMARETAAPIFQADQSS
jgi:ATP-binding cassette, subfamily B, bacterial PglK